MLGRTYVLNRASPREAHAGWEVATRQEEAGGYAARASPITWGGFLCPLPARKSTHHVMVYRRQSFGFARCRWGTAGAGGRSQERASVEGEPEYLSCSRRAVLVCGSERVSGRNQASREVGREFRRRREREKRGREEDGYYWGRSVNKVPGEQSSGARGRRETL